MKDGQMREAVGTDVAAPDLSGPVPEGGDVSKETPVMVDEMDRPGLSLLMAGYSSDVVERMLTRTK